MTNTARVVTAAAAMAAALGFAGLGTGTVAQAQPLRPSPENYHWCPGQPFNEEAWGNNFSVDACHDDHYFDGQPRDEAHWHGYTAFDPGWQGDGGGHRP